MTEPRAVNYLIAQTRQNISVLQELKQISHQDAELILSKLVIPQATTTGSPTPFRAKAKFNYNEDGKEPKDISFSAGDAIEVLEETNVDWWRGRCRGKVGLFPSSYVEKWIYDGASRPAPPPPGPSSPQMAPPAPSATYSPYPPPPQPYYGPPPFQLPASYQLYSGPPPGPVPVYINQQQPDNKKSGGLRNTLAQSAVSGAGFGAGSALASDIVNHLF